jgi:diaminohydroxyphosphoribosylaminopyrimidine deaminase/5-amino-6-(5-phosphoribosylamino)uracil reductase
MPVVGAVVVVEDKVAGNGFAASRDNIPAIIAAINEAGSLATRSTIYTNCEPLIDSTDPAHIEKLIACRPARIVVGTRINPTGYDEVLTRLRESGIEITFGVCEKRCGDVNEVYLKYSKTGLPFVTVKYAQTLDGRIATATGDSQWISSPPSLRLAHQLRREHDAILVGIGTVLKDDPRLTVRLVGGRDPLRIVIDSQLRIPLNARVIMEKTDRPTIIIMNDSSDGERANTLREAGAEVVIAPSASDNLGVDITAALRLLGRQSIASILVEGGSGIITSLLAAGAVDRMVVVTAPKIVGRGIEAVDNLGITRLNDAITFSSFKTRRIGPDIVFDGRMQNRKSTDRDL